MRFVQRINTMKICSIILLLGVSFLHWATSLKLSYGKFVFHLKEGTLRSSPAPFYFENIDLSSLQIQYIENDTFNHLPDVKKLDLSNNKLQSLPPLNKLNNLKELSVANNKLEFLTGSFVGLDNLKRLDISNNLINTLSRGDLFGLTKYTDIMIAGNPLEWLSSGTFEDPSLPVFEFGKKPKQPRLLMFGDKLKGLTTSKAIIPRAFTVKACVTDDDLMKFVRRLRKNEKFDGCREAHIDRKNRTLDMSFFGLKKFQRGWYKLSGNSISRLNLSGNDMTNITPELLNDLPSGLSSVDLKYNEIWTIKKNVIENRYCRSLNLEHNSLSTIEEGAFEKINLTSLSLAHNRLISINFVGTLPLNIERLYLHNNGIFEIPVNTFRRLKKLQIINLARNHLENIEPETFVNQENLLDLQLSCNRIDELHPEAFEGLKMVKKIVLTKNKIKKISRQTFSVLRKLNGFDLRLDRNEIDSIEEGSFSDLNITLLDLSGNKITDESIETGAFKKCTLAKLDLGQNSITKINGDLFHGILGTYQLSFSQNLIKNVKNGAAKYMANVSLLELSMNPLERLENGALYGLSKEKDVHVQLFATPIKVIQGGVFDNI